MKTKVIKFTTLDEMGKFTISASKVNGDVSLTRGAFSVDATSFIGVAALAELGEVVTVWYPDDAIEFEEFIKRYE